MDESFAHCHGHLWGVCNTPLHRYMKNGSLRVGGFNGESNSWREKDSINTYLIDTYQVCDSFAHCHEHLLGVCNTPLHGYTKNGSLWVGGFNGESNFWREKDSMNTYLIGTYRAGDSFAHYHGHLWGVCHTPLHWYTKNGSFRVGGFSGESIFWSVRVGAYCIRPQMYWADDSMDRRKYNFWSVIVGEYCIRHQNVPGGRFNR